MHNCDNLTVKLDTLLSDVLLILNKETVSKIVLVVDDNQRLMGTITDGDVRRALLEGFTAQSKASDVMFPEFKSVKSGISVNEIQQVFQALNVQQLPEVDENKKLLGLHLINDIYEEKISNSAVLIMAGGLGTRLSPLTDKCPKPMLRVGDKPILELILNNLKDQGFRKFFVSINYLGKQIIDYFGDGSNYGVTIDYIEEGKRLGTAGALSLLPKSVAKMSSPLIVINGDVLTKVNFKGLLEFHNELGSDITVCVRDYSIQIPYGVVNIEKNQVLSISEKPTEKYFVSAGIYALNPHILNKVIENTYLDMPDFLAGLLAVDSSVAAFPIHEYWMDIGQHENLSQAKIDFQELEKLNGS